jgi:hypothetical protein
MLTKSLLRCRACRLSWFPAGGTVAACPACGGERIGGTFELFHLGIALIALGLAGWIGPRFLGEGAMTVPVFAQASPVTAETEKSPAKRSDPVSVPSKKIKPHKVKRAKKAKKRSHHVQR